MRFCQNVAQEGALKSSVSPRNLFSAQCFEQLSPPPPPPPHHPGPTDSQGSVCCLTSIKTGALTPSPRCPSRPLHFTTTAIRSKLEEERIKMGNLPVIPRTTAKRAICLINSLFCRSAAWPSSIFPSAGPPMRPWRARDREVKAESGGRGAYGSRKEGRHPTCTKKKEAKGDEMRDWVFLLLTASILAAGNVMREDMPRLLSPSRPLYRFSLLIKRWQSRCGRAYVGAMGCRTSHCL